MRSLRSLLDHYKGIEPPDDSLKKATKDVLYSTLLVKIQLKNIKVNGKKILISANPVVKNAILLHKSDIQKKINEMIGGDEVYTIS